MHKLDVTTWETSDLKGAVTNLRNALSERNISMGLNQTRDLLAKAMGAQNWKSLESAIGKGRKDNATNSSSAQWVLTHTSYGDFGDPCINEWVGDSKTDVMQKFFDNVLAEHVAWEALADQISDSMDRYGISDYLTLNTSAYNAEEVILEGLVFTYKGSPSALQIIRNEQESLRPFVQRMIKEGLQEGNDLWDWEFITDKLADKISLRYWIESYQHGLGIEDEITIREISSVNSNEKASQELVYTLSHAFNNEYSSVSTFSAKTPQALDTEVFNGLVSDWAYTAFVDSVEIDSNDPQALMDQYPTGGLSPESLQAVQDAVDRFLPIDFDPVKEDDFAIKDRIYGAIPIRALIEAYEAMWDEEETFVWDQQMI